LLCGAAALVATRGHRDDLERTLAACAQEGPLRPWNGRQTHFINVSASELQARRVEVCEPGDWDEFLTAFGEGEVVAGAYQLFADGRISTLPMPDAWFDNTRMPFVTPVLSDREFQSQLEESAFEATTPIMLLYVDERSSRERRTI
jgi:hypothetical protein